MSGMWKRSHGRTTKAPPALPSSPDRRRSAAREGCKHQRVGRRPSPRALMICLSAARTSSYCSRRFGCHNCRRSLFSRAIARTGAQSAAEVNVSELQNRKERPLRCTDGAERTWKFDRDIPPPSCVAQSSRDGFRIWRSETEALNGAH
jgi:hypothetical protein